MTEMQTDNLEGGALEHLRERAKKIQAELRERGKQIDSGEYRIGAAVGNALAEVEENYGRRWR